MSEHIIPGLGAAFGFACLHLVDEHLLSSRGLSCLCPPLGAVAVLLFCMPNAPASQPKAVIGGHLVAGAVAFAVVGSGVQYPEAITVAVTIAAMSVLEVVHPPAGAYAFLFANKSMSAEGIIAPGLIGACVLVGAQILFNAIRDLISGKKPKFD
jgi:CBS-domain-containing membrane protein